MSASLALMHSADASPLDRPAAFQALREMVLNSVVSEHSKRNYAKALDEVFTLCANRSQGLSRALLTEYRAAMLEKKLSASTVNVRLSAVRKLIGEAQRNGIIGAEEAANLAGVPNLSQKGTRVVNWLTREQAKDIRQRPDGFYSIHDPVSDVRYPCDPDSVWRFATAERVKGKKLRSKTMEVLIEEKRISWPVVLLIMWRRSLQAIWRNVRQGGLRIAST